MVMQFFQKVNEYLEVIATIGAVMFFLFLFGKIVAELWLITTVIAVVLLTRLAFNRWTTAISAVAGIALYTTSWFTLGAWSAFFTVLICSLGFLTWSMAVIRAYSNRFLATESSLSNPQLRKEFG